MSPLVTGALAATDELYVPVASGRGALDGLGDIVYVTRRGGMPTPNGAFVTRVNTSSHHDVDLVEYVRDSVDDNVSGFVRETVRVREAEMARVPLPIYAPGATATADYYALAGEIELAGETKNTNPPPSHGQDETTTSND